MMYYFIYKPNLTVFSTQCKQYRLAKLFMYG